MPMIGIQVYGNYQQRLSVFNYMITGSRQVAKQIVSPRQSYRRPTKSNAIQSVEKEYQMRTNRRPGKDEDRINKRIPTHTSKDKQRSFTKRKLSFKSIQEGIHQYNRDLQVKNCLQVKKLSVKENRHPTAQELAIQIEYHQFNLPTKDQVPPQTSTSGSQHIFRRRIQRIKSSDNLSLTKNSGANQKQLESKIHLAQQENISLKRLKSETLLKLQSLEKVYNQEKSAFVGQTVSYQRKIEALTRKIHSNRNELGHIYSYPAFDPVKLMVKPIVQLEGESSQMRSLIKTSELPFEDLQYQSRMQKVVLRESVNKEEMTQRTGPSSRQQYGELDCF